MQIGNVGKKTPPKHIANLFTFSPQRALRQNTFLYTFIVASYISFLGPPFLLPTRKAEWSSAVSLSQYHITEVEEHLGCSFHHGAVGVQS